jgi:hypothetical protein
MAVIPLQIIFISSRVAGGVWKTGKHEHSACQGQWAPDTVEAKTVSASTSELSQGKVLRNIRGNPSYMECGNLRARTINFECIVDAYPELESSQRFPDKFRSLLLLLYFCSFWKIWGLMRVEDATSHHNTAVAQWMRDSCISEGFPSNREWRFDVQVSVHRDKFL